MSNYIASEDLINIFIKNGFIDITDIKRPEHFKRLQENGYDPHKIKRVISYNGHLKNYVEFDYIMIRACYKEGCDSRNMKNKITANELKSIIAFYKLPSQTMSAMNRKGYDRLNLYDSYEHVKENLDFYKGQKTKLMLLEIFENIKL